MSDAAPPSSEPVPPPDAAPYLECPSCQGGMVGAAGELGENVCGRCRGRFVPSEIAQDFLARHVGVTPETVHELTRHYSGRRLVCPSCGKRTSRIPLRGENVDACTGCGSLFLPEGVLARITANAVNEVNVVEPPRPPPQAPPAEEPGDLRRQLLALPAALGALVLLRSALSAAVPLLSAALEDVMGAVTAHALASWARAVVCALVSAPVPIVVVAVTAPSLRREWMKLCFWVSAVVSLSDAWNGLRGSGLLLGGVIALAAAASAAWAWRVRSRLDAHFAQSRHVPWVQLRQGARRIAWSAGLAVVVLGVGVGAATASTRADERARRGFCGLGTERQVVVAEGREEIRCLEGRVPHGPSEVRYLSGQKAESGTWVHGVKTGEWAGWHPDGKQRYLGRYDAGRRTGLWRTWDLNGTVEKEGAFLDDQEDGRWVEYHPVGTPRSEGFFVRGQRSGRWVFRRVDGTVVREGTFERGAEHGTWTEVDATGKVHRVLYANGRRFEGPAP